MQLLTKYKTGLFLFVFTVITWVSGMLLLFWADADRGSSVNHEAIVQGFTQNLTQHLDELNQLNERWKEQWSNGPLVTLTAVGSTDFCILADQEFLKWSGNRFIPPVRFSLNDFTIKYLHTSAGDFIIRKWYWTEHASLLAVIPLNVQYPIQNEYLRPWRNELIFGNADVSIYDPGVSVGLPVQVEDVTLFRCQVNDGFWLHTTPRTWGIVCMGMAIGLFVSLLLWLYVRVFNWSGRGVLMLALGLVGLRFAMILSKFPTRFIELTVFDARYFASSELNPSLGDLVLNALVVSALCFLLLVYIRTLGKQLVKLRSKIWFLPLAIFSVTAVLFGALFPFIVIQTIYNNSAITLNISESIRFDLLRILSFLAVVLAWVSSFLFIHTFLRVVMLERKAINRWLAVGVGLGLFLWINKLTGQQYSYVLLLAFLYVAAVVYFKLYKSLGALRYQTFTYFFAALLFFASSGLVAVNHFNLGEKAQQQFRFANSFLIDRDDFGEFLLAESMEKISSDLFIQTRLSGLFANREAVKQKVRQVFIPGYFNKYSVMVHLFGANGESLDDTRTQNFSSMIGAFDREALRTDYEGIYFINRPDNESARKYVAVIPIKRNELSAGYIVLELLLKRIIPNSVYPELLVDNRFQEMFQAQDFSYAIWQQDEVQVQSGEFNYRAAFQSVLNSDRIFTKGVTQSGYLHTASSDASGRVVVVSSPLSPFVYQIADFSFLIILGLFVLLLFLAVIGLIDYLSHERLLLSTRIQLILNLAFFIPLITVSVITLGLTARSNQQQLSSEYEAKSRNFSNEISSLFEADTEDAGAKEQDFMQLSKLASLDANLFNPYGRLRFTTQPLVFENALQAPYINPIALSRIRQGDRVFTLDEKIGDLQYFVSYSALYAPDGGLTGIIGIPFYQSGYLLERMQINVLANILSIFTLIFAVLVIISYWVSRWLTFPLQMITQKLGRISLTQSNQPMEWSSDDEIGIMVREYNQMLASLSDSKRELERTQRERAWREIAQQVAHEIKNPLTPMKLMLQQAERIQDSDPQKAQKIRRTIASLLSQVDTLDGIASSFSAFAKMPEPVMHKVELVELIRTVVQLHAASMGVAFTTALEVAWVMADQQLLQRILSNILLNSLQAKREAVPLEVRLELSISGNHVILKLSDNGTGIDEQLQDKIFLPHFSTKKSGSGLGLAIARQGIEQMGGRIYFTSEVGEGTVFYIELPIPEHDEIV